MVVDLQIAGLLAAAGRGRVAAGPITLEDIAARQRLDHVRQTRLHRHRLERTAWRRWLSERNEHRDSPRPLSAPAGLTSTPAQFEYEEQVEHAAWLKSVMSTGPPTYDIVGEEHAAIEIIAELLGGRLVNT